KSAPDVILTVDRTGRILFANRSLWGYSAESLISSLVVDCVPERERPAISKCLEEVFGSGKAAGCEVSGADRFDRSWAEVSFGSAHQLEVQDGKRRTTTTTTTTTIQIRDITEEKLNREKLRMSSQQLRELAAGIEAVREEERARVAREIHDELGQALTVTKLD